MLAGKLYGLLFGQRRFLKSLLCWQSTPTNRTNFLSQINHYGEFALGAFDRVEFDSSDFVSVHKAVWLSGLPSYDKRNKSQL
jgi:hypothetical protein